MQAAIMPMETSKLGFGLAEERRKRWGFYLRQYELVMPPTEHEDEWCWKERNGMVMIPTGKIVRNGLVVYYRSHNAAGTGSTSGSQHPANKAVRQYTSPPDP